MDTRADSRIMMFVKAPAAGTVKTRLCRDLNPEDVLLLYRAFILDLLDTLARSGKEIQICYDPPDAENTVRSWLGLPDRMRMSPQQGNDLGTRMERAFVQAFAEGCQNALLIGSDIPDLPADILNQAERALDTREAVIGPSSDGGYYLIGFTRDGFLEETFRGMPWSTDAVMARTIAVFEEYKTAFALMPKWHDIDTYKDLLVLSGDCRRRPQAAPRTREVLIRLGL